VLFLCCRLIKYYLIYVRLTLTLAKVCPHTRLITWRRGGRIGESGGIKKVGARGKDNGRICTGV